MNIILYSITDGVNVINKTLTDPLTIPIKLRNDVDVNNPVIKLRSVDGVNYDDYNYAFIDVLGRYYYVDRIARVSAIDTTLYLSCDVLETYKDDILNSNAQFTRNVRQGDYGNFQIDGEIVNSISLFKSDGGFSDVENSVILTTIGD